jgi:hypothetical protein
MKLFAGVTDVLYREQRGGLPGRDRERSDATFQSGDALFQNGLCRIHDAGVDVAQFFQGEQVSRMLGRVELVRCRLINRNCHGGCCRV